MGSTDAATSMIQQVRQAMLVRDSFGVHLDAVGNNRGVPRPDNTSDDDLYRRLIQALAWIPKGTLLSYYALIAAVFGSQEQNRAQVGRTWKVYEVNVNEVVVEVPVAVVVGTLGASSYVHGASGYARVAAGPTDVFTADFDLRSSIATSVVGAAIHVETSAGTWTDYTVVSYTFDGTTAIVKVSAATLPTGGGRFYLEVPGDGVSSYRGDYVATGGVATLYSTAAGPATNTLLVRGDITRGVAPGMVAQISVSGVVQSRVVSTLTYSGTTNVTTVVITTTDVPGGQSGQTFVVPQEVADTATTPSHNDRVYLTGVGLYQIVQFYLDLLVRTAGVVVRLAIV